MEKSPSDYTYQTIKNKTLVISIYKVLEIAMDNTKIKFQLIGHRYTVPI